MDDAAKSTEPKKETCGRFSKRLSARMKRFSSDRKMSGDYSESKIPPEGRDAIALSPAGVNKEPPAWRQGMAKVRRENQPYQMKAHEKKASFDYPHEMSLLGFKSSQLKIKEEPPDEVLVQDHPMYGVEYFAGEDFARWENEARERQETGVSAGGVCPSQHGEMFHCDTCELNFNNSEMFIHHVQSHGSCSSGYVSAKTGRISAKTSGTSAKTDRSPVKTGRVSAKTGRVSAKTGRVSAKTGRVSAKTGRVSAKTDRSPVKTGHVSAKTGRVSAKTGRVSAKTGHVSAKTGRVSAKTGRVSAKTGRSPVKTGQVSAKTGRVSDKTGRVSAKTGRSPVKTGQVSPKTLTADGSVLPSETLENLDTAGLAFGTLISGSTFFNPDSTFAKSDSSVSYSGSNSSSSSVNWSNSEVTSSMQGYDSSSSRNGESNHENDSCNWQFSMHGMAGGAASTVGGSCSTGNGSCSTGNGSCSTAGGSCSTAGGSCSTAGDSGCTAGGSLSSAGSSSKERTSNKEVTLKGLASAKPGRVRQPNRNKCEACGKGFKLSCNLSAHKRIHTGERPFECTICNKTFSDPSNFNRHKKTHEGLKPHQCSICKETFTRLMSLERHHVRSHGLPKESITAVADTAGHPIAAPQSVGHRVAGSFTCEVCGKELPSARVLQNHRIAHLDKTHVCNTCNKRFHHEEGLKSHMKHHAVVRPFTCTVCGKGFTERRFLTRHHKIHTGIKPHVCQTCGKSFVRGSCLAVHERIHLTKKPVVPFLSASNEAGEGEKQLDRQEREKLCENAGSFETNFKTSFETHDE